MPKKKKEKTYTEERVEEFLDENETTKPPKDDALPESETKESEAPEVPEKAEVSEPEKPMEKEIDVSEVKEELKKEVKEEISAEVKDELVKSITGKTEEEIEEKTPWAKEGRTPKDYDEIATWAKDQAKTELQKEDEEVKKKTEEKEKANLEYWNKTWDTQLEGLEKEGKIPKVENKEDPNDAGLKARKDLFVAANENKEYNLELVYYKHYDKKKQPAGADAPVSGGRKSVSKEPEGEFKYSEIHGARELSDLVKS